MSAAEAAMVDATAKAPAASSARTGTKLRFTCFLHPFGQLQRTTGSAPAASPRPVLALLFECWPRTHGTQKRMAPKSGELWPAFGLPSLQARAELAAGYAGDV